MHIMQHGYNALVKLVQSIFHPFFAPLYVHENFIFISTMQWCVFLCSVVVFCIMHFGRIRITKSGHTSIYFHFQLLIYSWILCSIYEKRVSTSSWHCNAIKIHIWIIYWLDWATNKINIIGRLFWVQARDQVWAEARAGIHLIKKKIHSKSTDIYILFRFAIQYVVNCYCCCKLIAIEWDTNRWNMHAFSLSNYLYTIRIYFVTSFFSKVF